MTHCGEKWVNMIDKSPEICEMSEDYRRKIERWRQTCEGIIDRGFERNLVFKKFPEGAHRELPDDGDPLKVRALNYVCECLGRNEKVTGSDLKKTIAGWREKKEKCTSCTGEDGDTNVLPSSPDSEVKPDPEPLRTTSCTGENGDTNVLPSSPDSEVKPDPEALAPEWSTATCKTGKCPDGQCHLIKGAEKYGFGDKCALSGAFTRDQKFCTFLERQKREAAKAAAATRGGFTSAGTGQASIQHHEEAPVTNPRDAEREKRDFHANGLLANLPGSASVVMVDILRAHPGWKEADAFFQGLVKLGEETEVR